MIANLSAQTGRIRITHIKWYIKKLSRKGCDSVPDDTKTPAVKLGQKNIKDVTVKPKVDMSEVTDKVKELCKYLERANSLIDELATKQISLHIDI